MEGLSRWNADRSAAAVSDVSTGPETYSGALANAANDLSTSAIGKKIQPGLQEVGAYTGGLIGVEYLFSQTGEVLENKCDDDDISNSSSTPLSDIDDSQREVDEGFVDSDEQTVGLVPDVFSHQGGTVLKPQGQRKNTLRSLILLPCSVL